MEEIDLSKYEEKTVVKRYKVEGSLVNIHGEHAERTQMISKITFDESKTITEGEKEKIETRKQKAMRPETVHTFPKDNEGYLLVPLGSAHGYIMGALRTALVDLYKDKLKDNTWKGYGLKSDLNHGLLVKPEWVRVEKTFSNSPEHPIAHMIITSGINKSMMPIYYDVISEAKVEFEIEQTNPKITEDILFPMLSYIQRLGLGPKGRGNLKIEKLTRTKG